MVPIKWMWQAECLALMCLFVTLTSCQTDKTVFSWNITLGNNDSVEVKFSSETFNEFFGCLFSQSKLLCKININKNNTASYVGYVTNVRNPQSNVTRYICSLNESEPSITCTKVNMTQDDEICSNTRFCIAYSMEQKTWNNTYELPFVEISLDPNVTISASFDGSHSVDVRSCVPGCMFETPPPPPTESTMNTTISTMTSILSTNIATGPTVMSTADTTRPFTESTKTTTPSTTTTFRPPVTTTVPIVDTTVPLIKSTGPTMNISVSQMGTTQSTMNTSVSQMVTTQSTMNTSVSQMVTTQSTKNNSVSQTATTQSAMNTNVSQMATTQSTVKTTSPGATTGTTVNSTTPTTGKPSMATTTESTANTSGQTRETIESTLATTKSIMNTITTITSPATMNVSQPPTVTTKSTLSTFRSTATAEISTQSSLESSVESTINSDSTQSTNTEVFTKDTEKPSASPLPPLSDEPLVSDSSSALTDEQIIIIGLVVGIVIVIAALIIVGVILWRRRERSRALLLANDSIITNTDHKENEIQEDLDGDYSTIEAILRPGTRSLIRDRPTLKFTDTYITNNNETELKKAMNSLDLNKGTTQDNTNPDSPANPKAPDSSKSEGKGITDVYATINSHTKQRNAKKAPDTGKIEETPDVPPGPQTPDRSASGSSDDSGANNADNPAINLMDATESSDRLTTLNGDEKLIDKSDVTTNPENRYIDYRL